MFTCTAMGVQRIVTHWLQSAYPPLMSLGIVKPVQKQQLEDFIKSSVSVRIATIECWVTLQRAPTQTSMIHCVTNQRTLLKPVSFYTHTHTYTLFNIHKACTLTLIVPLYLCFPRLIIGSLQSIRSNSSEEKNKMYSYNSACTRAHYNAACTYDWIILLEQKQGFSRL